MSSIFSDAILEIASKPCFGFATSVDSEGNTFPSRVFGYDFNTSNDELTVFLFKELASPLLESAETSKRVAVCLAFAYTLEALQFKGTMVESRDVHDADVSKIDQMREEYNKMLSGMGLPDGHVDTWKNKPAVALKVKVEKVFNQTPGQNTGNRIS